MLSALSYFILLQNQYFVSQAVNPRVHFLSNRFPVFFNLMLSYIFRHKT